MPTRRDLLLSLPVLFGSTSAGAASSRMAWDPPIDLANGRGLRGPWQQNDSRYDFVDDPAAAFTADGALVTAWVDQAAKAVLVRRHDASAPQPPVRVDGQPDTFSWLPRLACAPDAPGQVLVLWQEIIFSGGSHGGDMLLARSGDGGRSFSPAMNLSRSVGGDGKGRITPEYWHNGSYDLLVGPGGRAWAAWTEYDGPLWFTSSADGGRSFAPPAQVAGGARRKPTRAPALALAPDGAVLLAWTEGDNPQADIHVARAADGRRFKEPVIVARSRGYSDAPQLAVDARGGVHLAYAEAPAGPFTPQRILHARSADGGRRFGAPRVLTPDLPAPWRSASHPSLALDAQGRVYVVFELQQDLRRRPRALGLVVSADGGERFSPPEPVPHGSDPRGGFNGSSQGLLQRKLAARGDGELAIVNSALLEGSHSRVWLVRGRYHR
jgi:hypothetical protein